MELGEVKASTLRFIFLLDAGDEPPTVGETPLATPWKEKLDWFLLANIEVAMVRRSNILIYVNVPEQIE